MNEGKKSSITGWKKAQLTPDQDYLPAVQQLKKDYGLSVVLVGFFCSLFLSE